MTLVTVRPGVAFQADAAASFVRMEAQRGRRLDVNRTTVTWDEQMEPYRKYLAYKNGTGPAAPLALHPSKTKHVYRPGDPLSATAWDTDERGAWLDENGWMADVAGEPWHREYRRARDKHFGQVAGNGSDAFDPEQPNPEEDDAMRIFRETNGSFFLAKPGGIVGIRGTADLRLLRRLLDSKPGAEDTFNAAERDIIASYMRG